MIRVSINILIALLFSASSNAAPVPYIHCNTPAILADLFQMKPDQIQWKVDLRPKCRITDQGVLGSCWANSGVEVYNQWLHQAGVLKADQYLSTDYYAAVRIWLNARQKFNSLFDMVEKIGPGQESYYVQKFQDLFFGSGLVLEGDFQFPKIAGKSIRESKELHAEFYQKLNDAKDKKSPVLFNIVLQQYLGSFQAARVRVPTVAFKNAFHEKIYGGAILKNTSIKEIETEITGALDRGLPVSFGIQNFGRRLFVAKKSSYVYPGKPNPIFDSNSGHAMNIIGYHLKSSGEVDHYLIENSWGVDYASKGTFTIPAAYLYRQTRSYAIPAAQVLNTQ